MYEIIFLVLWWLFWLLPMAAKKQARRVQQVGGALLLLLAGVATLGDYKNVWYPTVIVQKACVMRLGPGEKYRMCGKIAAQEQACILNQKESWYKLEHGGNCGWVYASCNDDCTPL